MWTSGAPGASASSSVVTARQRLVVDVDQVERLARPSPRRRRPPRRPARPRSATTSMARIGRSRKAGPIVRVAPVEVGAGEHGVRRRARARAPRRRRRARSRACAYGERRSCACSHARQLEVGDVARAAGDLLERVDAAARSGPTTRSGAARGSPRQRRPRVAGAASDRVDDLAVARAAAEVAAQVVQHVARASATGCSSSSALAVSSMPDVQKPHCTAPRVDERLLERVRARRRRPRPSTVSTVAPVGLDGQVRAGAHRPRRRPAPCRRRTPGVSHERLAPLRSSRSRSTSSRSACGGHVELDARGR